MTRTFLVNCTPSQILRMEYSVLPIRGTVVLSTVAFKTLKGVNGKGQSFHHEIDGKLKLLLFLWHVI